MRVVQQDANQLHGVLDRLDRRRREGRARPHMERQFLIGSVQARRRQEVTDHVWWFSGSMFMCRRVPL